jgi:pectate lyase
VRVTDFEESFMFKSLLPVALVGLLGACNGGSPSSASREDAAPSRGDGGNAGSGGVQAGGTTSVTASGGTSAVGTGGQGGGGGAIGTGGSVSTGGAIGSGGSVSAGGTSSSGAGGRTGGAAGGTTATGGTVSTGGRTGTGGTTTAGGNASTGGRTGAGGATASGGAIAKGGTTGTGGSTSAGGPSCSTTLPAATSKVTVSSTVSISGSKDYGMQQVCADPNALGPGDQTENQKPVFLLAANAVLKNVIIGGSGCSAADGVHCESGSCTLENVWFGDVGEDAVTFKGSSTSQVMTITGGGAFSASDKVIQHNGPGTIKISGFYVSDAGKLYRSCGNCGTQYARHVVLDYVTAKSVKWLVGINTNYNDTATLTHITLCGSGTTVCEKYTGNNTGAEPPAIGSGPDGTNCIYTNSDITTL